MEFGFNFTDNFSYFGTDFTDNFPCYSNISLENNPPKLDSSNLVGNSNANNIHDSLNNHPFTTPFPSHPHQHYQDAYFHAHGHGHHPFDNHHQGVFPSDLNIVPPIVMPNNNTIAADYCLDGNNHEPHISDHHHDPRGHGDEPMIVDQISGFHDPNNMLRDETCQPEGKAVQGISQIKGQWSAKEDRLLIQLVERHGVKRWSLIAKELGTRVGKQCRERWNNHLRPDIRKDVWTLEEDTILIKAHREFGNKWCKIAKRLPGRSENTIKNHWNATKRKQSFAGRTKPGGSSNGSGSTLLQDYINSTMPSQQEEGEEEQEEQQQVNK